MQVGTERQAGSELHAWRQFLARSTLWLGVLLLGSAAICWVAANWQDMSKVQRFAGAQALLAVCAGRRLGRIAPADRRRRAWRHPGALLALAGILLGALLALLGQTYQTGADTWELFAWWAVLLLPWALAAASQAVWLLWTLVVNVAMVLWLGERVFSWWGLLGATYLPALIVAGLNLVILAVGNGRAAGAPAPGRSAPAGRAGHRRAGDVDDAPTSSSAAATAARRQHRLAGGHAGPGFLLSEGAPRPGHPGHAGRRRDLRLLRVVGNGCWLEPGAWRCRWPCSWPRRSGPRAGCAGWPPRASGRAGGRCRARQRLGRQSRGPGPRRRAGGPGRPARDARRRRALVCAMPAGPERLAGDAAAAVVHRLVPDRQHAGRRAGRRAGAARPAWPCCAARPVRSGGSAARRWPSPASCWSFSEYQTPRHSPTPACSCWPWPWRCTCWVPISSCASSAAC